MIKKMLFVMLVIPLLAMSAMASNFALIDPDKPQTSAGIYTDMENGNSAAGANVALITHSYTSTTNVVASVLDGWTPLNLGGTVGDGLGGPSIALGTGLNLLPATRTTIANILTLVAPNSLSGLKSALTVTNSDDNYKTVKLFAGPSANLVFTSLKSCKLIPTFYFGATYTWGSSSSGAVSAKAE